MPAPATIGTRRLHLVLLSPRTLDRLLAGGGRRLGGVDLPLSWLRENEWLLRLRRDQAHRDPAQAQWLLRAILHRRLRRVVGHVGFHGAPGANALGAPDAVEVGFTVEPEFRRQGLATEAADALIRWARRERGIGRFLASVRPDNAPSLALVRRLGFTEVARVWDEAEGEEIVFELRVGALRGSPSSSRRPRTATRR